jgi:hypothetical protein
MSTHTIHARNAPAKRSSLEVRLIFAVCFVPALARAAVLRLVRGRTDNRSIVAEAKAAAYSCVSFAFMG